MSPTPLIVDGTELLADAIARFAEAMAGGHYDVAERFAALAFYLLQHRVDAGRR